MEIIKQHYTEEEIDNKNKEKNILHVTCSDCGCEFKESTENFDIIYRKLSNPNGNDLCMPWKLSITCPNCGRKLEL